MNKKTCISVFALFIILICIVFYHKTKKGFPKPTSQTAQKKKKYFLSLLTMFKNEAHIFVEWLEHYLAEGIEHFYLIDNNSNDNYKEKIQSYIDKGIVTIIPESRNFMQSADLNRLIPEKAKETTWLIGADLDEFAYAKWDRSIKEYLQKSPVVKCPDNRKVGQIFIYWKMYGSSGFKKQPKLVVPNFVYRARTPNNRISIWTKTILYTDAWLPPDWHCQSISCGIHSSHIDESKYCNIFSNGTYMPFQRIKLPVTEYDYPRQNIQLNHYIVQSEEFYRKVKITRGDSNSNKPAWENRQMKDFYNQDINDILDDELKQKRALKEIVYKNKIYIPKN